MCSEPTGSPTYTAGFGAIFLLNVTVLPLVSQVGVGDVVTFVTTPAASVDDIDTWDTVKSIVLVDNASGTWITVFCIPDILSVPEPILPIFPNVMISPTFILIVLKRFSSV